MSDSNEINGQAVQQQMQPSPVPTQFAVGLHGETVVLQVNTPVGSQVYFLDQNTARAVGEMILQACSRVVVVPTGLAAQLAAQAATRFRKG